jgi:hypothetical protein
MNRTLPNARPIRYFNANLLCVTDCYVQRLGVNWFVCYLRDRPMYIQNVVHSASDRNELARTVGQID